MEKENPRRNVRTIDLVELLIMVVIAWMAEKLLDSVWKGVVTALSGILARRRDSNREERNPVRELGYALMLSTARFMEVDEEQVKSYIDQAVKSNKFSYTAGIEILRKMFVLSFSKRD